jgi:Spy/CpxP family protein refolding chaperone
MRIQLPALFSALLAALALAGAAAAGGRFGEHPGRHDDPGRLLEEYADELGLDEQTLEDLERLFAASHAEAEPIRDELHEERARLRELVGGEDPDPDQVMRQVERVGELETELRQLRLGTWLHARSLLTSDQEALLGELREEHRLRCHARRLGP